jgi:hypothetical protein
MQPGQGRDSLFSHESMGERPTLPWLKPEQERSNPNLHQSRSRTHRSPKMSPLPILSTSAWQRYCWWPPLLQQSLGLKMVGRSRRYEASETFRHERYKAGLRFRNNACHYLLIFSHRHVKLARQSVTRLIRVSLIVLQSFSPRVHQLGMPCGRRLCTLRL